MKVTSCYTWFAAASCGLVLCSSCWWWSETSVCDYCSI